MIATFRSCTSWTAYTRWRWAISADTQSDDRIPERYNWRNSLGPNLGPSSLGFSPVLARKVAPESTKALTATNQTVGGSNPSGRATFFHLYIRRIAGVAFFVSNWCPMARWKALREVAHKLYAASINIDQGAQLLHSVSMASARWRDRKCEIAFGFQ
jgi:hypothetical protein